MVQQDSGLWCQRRPGGIGRGYAARRRALETIVWSMAGGRSVNAVFDGAQSATIIGVTTVRERRRGSGREVHCAVCRIALPVGFSEMVK